MQGMKWGNAGNRWINLIGMTVAIGIAFGSVFFVQAKLEEEAAELLEGSGMIEVPVQSYETEAQGLGTAETEEKKLLTAEELVQVIENLDSETTVVYAHEPLQGQLSIRQALECGSTWLEDFLLPCLGVEERLSGDYKTSCSLWEMREKGEAEESNLLFSYWTVALNSQDVAASLTLNAVTGQVLDAHVSCYFPIEYSENGGLILLLEDYTDSFGLEEEYSSMIVGSDGRLGDGKWGMYKFLEDGKLFSVLQTESYAISSVKTDNIAIMEQNIYSIHLYVGNQVENCLIH